MTQTADAQDQYRSFSDAMRMTPERAAERRDWVKARSVDTFAALRLRGLLLWTDGDESADLVAALNKKGIAHQDTEVPYIVGMAGYATIVRYVSLNTGNPVEAIYVPKQADVDSFGITTFSFAGGSLPSIEDREAMIEIYEHCDAALKAHYEQSRRLYTEYDAPRIEAAKRVAGFIK